MSRMHTSKIGDRWQPVLVINIMKNAEGPLTMQDIYDEIRDRGHKKFSPSMVGACFAEIRDDKGGEGYAMSPAVLFPDGYHRYWLTRAPNWEPRWKLIPEYEGKKMVRFRIVRRGSQKYTHPQLVPRAAEKAETAAPGCRKEAQGESAQERKCSYPPCTNPVPAERLAEGYMTCSEEHSKAWRDLMSAKFRVPAAAGSGQMGLL